MPALAHELLTFATLGLTVAWIVRHFLRPQPSCDGCSSAKRSAPVVQRGIRPAALRVLSGRGAGLP